MQFLTFDSNEILYVEIDILLSKQWKRISQECNYLENVNESRKLSYTTYKMTSPPRQTR